MEIVKVILDRIRFIPFIPRSVLFCLIMLSRNRLWTHMPPVVILFVCIDSNSLCNRARLTSQALVEEHSQRRWDKAREFQLMSSGAKSSTIVFHGFSRWKIHSFSYAIWIPFGSHFGYFEADGPVCVQLT